MLRNAKKAYFNNFTISDKKTFWKTMKYMHKEQSTVPPLSHNGTTVQGDIGKANMLNTFFSKCFNTALPPLSEQDRASQHLGQPPDECPDELLCTESEILKFLKAINISKASGPDNISGRMLKSTATYQHSSIYYQDFQSVHNYRNFSPCMETIKCCTNPEVY